MNFKKFLAVMSACAVTAISGAVMSAGVNAAGFPSNAYLSGSIGSTEVKNIADVTAGSTTATVNGDAQYEVEWKVDSSAGAVNNIGCLIVSIPGVSTNTYSGMNITVDAVYIDGRQISYITSPTAVNMAYTAIGQDPSTKIYLYDGWDNTNVADIAANTPVTDSVKVQFTISGTGITGTSNVIQSPTEASTEAPFITAAPTDSPAGFMEPDVTTVPAAVTGDGGIAAVAVAGLAITACAAVLSKVKFGKKKK